MAFRSLTARRNERCDSAQLMVACSGEKVSFRLRKALADILGWVHGDHLDIQPGDGDDVGDVRLVDDPKGWKLRLTSNSTNILLVELSARLLLHAEKHAAASAHWRIDGENALIVRLPWAAAVSTAAAASIAASESTSLSAEQAPIEAAVPAAAVAVSQPAASHIGRPSHDLPPATRKRFIEAAASGVSDAALAAICGRPRGSIYRLRTVAFAAEIAVARRAGEVMAVLKARAASGDGPEKPPVPDAVLRFVREQIAPVLTPLGQTIEKSRDGSGLLLNGQPVEIEALVAEANRILGAAEIAMPAL